MNNKLGIYEKALPSDISWEERFKLAKDNNFDFIELSVDINRLDKLDYTDKQINELLLLSNKTLFCFVTVFIL